MYHSFTQEELRAYCRTCIESLEIWARRLIHEKMVERYGDKYIELSLPDGNYLIKKEIRDHISRLQKNDPKRFSRPVDCLFIDQIIYFLCKQDWYQSLFKEALDFAYPQGREEAREFLNQLVPIRNSLSHANPISIRQAEKVICYSHDFIDGLKEYYKLKGKEKMWNVPRIIKITDSLGNIFENPTEKNVQCSIFTISSPLYCGDTYSVTAEVDPAFSPSSYDLIWEDDGHELDEFKNNPTYVTKFDVGDVEELHRITCIIISHESWHKYKYYDCQINLHLTVLPPVNP